MAIPMFLAMTGAEWQANQDITARIAWMACHFSPYGTGLSNRPKSLPPRSLLILNDRTPVWGHDPELIARQLAKTVTELDCQAVLLDFQRPQMRETLEIVNAISQRVPCPVAVTEFYAEGLDCPVFLSPVPPNISLGQHLAPWKGREIWLELALDGMEISVTSEGPRFTPLPLSEPESAVHRDEELLCHYDIAVLPERIRFRLGRTPEDIAALLSAAEEQGVTCAVGLFQELGHQMKQT